MLRIYATNKANPSLQRMICLLSSNAQAEEISDQQLPIYLQYVTMSTRPLGKILIKPHGNSTKSTRPFTSTVPAVLEHSNNTSKLRVILKTNEKI